MDQILIDQQGLKHRLDHSCFVREHHRRDFVQSAHHGDDLQGNTHSAGHKDAIVRMYSQQTTKQLCRACNELRSHISIPLPDLVTNDV